MIQMSIFDMIREPIRITKPIRLIELFAGYGSQAMIMSNDYVMFEVISQKYFEKIAEN